MRGRPLIGAASVGGLVLSVALVLGNRDEVPLAASPPGPDPMTTILTELTQLQAAVSALQTQVNILYTFVHLRGVTQSWDKPLPANDPGGACPNNSSRFTCVMGGAAVQDNNTGLVWEQSPGTTVQTWRSARQSCADKSIRGQKGWRLPSIHELASLVDPNQTKPALPVGHPFTNVQSPDFNFPPASYWSATSDADFPTFAWVMHLKDGFGEINNKTLTNYVWCVRGGMQESYSDAWEI